jgi:hypothetical protein
MRKFPFGQSPAISIHAHTSFIANRFRTIPFSSGWSCFNRPWIGRDSAKLPRRLTGTNSPLVPRLDFDSRLLPAFPPFVVLSLQGGSFPFLPFLSFFLIPIPRWFFSFGKVAELVEKKELIL